MLIGATAFSCYLPSEFVVIKEEEKESGQPLAVDAPAFADTAALVVHIAIVLHLSDAAAVFVDIPVRLYLPYPTAIQVYIAIRFDLADTAAILVYISIAFKLAYPASADVDIPVGLNLPDTGTAEINRLSTGKRNGGQQAAEQNNFFHIRRKFVER